MTAESFNHHDPEIERMMWERAHAQGAAHNAETVLGTRVIVGSGIDIAALRTAIQSFVDGFEAAMAHVVETINSYGASLADLARKLEALNEPTTENHRHHGAASVCPRHGPTKGGLCRRCAR